MRRLMMINTYYQLIVGIQLANTIFRNDEVVVLISDHSRNACNIASKLSNMGIFKQTLYIKTRGSKDNRSFIEKACDFLQISFWEKNRYSYYLEKVDNLFFDELIFYNYNASILGVFSNLSDVNKEVKVSIFEEGIINYTDTTVLTTSKKIIGLLRRFQNKASIDRMFNNFYCFYSTLYHGSFQPVTIPLVEIGSDTADLLKRVFNPDLSIYNKKYIFFTSVYDFEGGKPVGEYELVCKVADLVGKDNLLVKTHPRDVRTIYTDNGFNVDKNSSIPWEVIQLSGDFSDKVFMTINSGSVLSGNTMSDKTVRTYYMYKLCDLTENEPCKKNARYIESLLKNENMKKILRTVKIAERLEDIL